MAQSKKNIIIGNGEMINCFISEIELSPKNFKNVVLASPFIELINHSDIGKRIFDVLIEVKKNGGEVHLISELSKVRKNIFRKIINTLPESKNIISLCPKLHAKCGYAITYTGLYTAFLGSANFTKSGCNRNHEINMIVRATIKQEIEWWLFTQIKCEIDKILINSNSLEKPKLINRSQLWN